jgi:hypothetical protein
MIEITQKEFESNIDHYMDLIEKERKEFIIRLDDGNAVAAVPVDEEIQKLLDIMPEIPYTDVED